MVTALRESKALVLDFVLDWLNKLIMTEKMASIYFYIEQKYFTAAAEK